MEVIAAEVFGVRPSRLANSGNWRTALLAGSAIGLGLCMATASNPARAANDGVVFDGAATDNATATAIGSFGISSSTATGATAAGKLGMAVGVAAFTDANSGQAIAIGIGAGTQANGVTVGESTPSAVISNIAIGTNARATATGATALGGTSTNVQPGALALGQNATAIGANAEAGGTFINGISNAGTTAVGAGAQAGTGAGQTNATAIGFLASANAQGATALGQGSTAGFANSTAIGAGASTTRANQVVVGTATTTYTMPGVSSAASLAAQTGAVSFVTSDANGNLATSSFNPTSVGALQGNVTALQNNVTILQGNVAVLQQQMRQSFEGTAMAIAMGGSSLPADKKFAISTNLGTFRGENALGLLAQARVSDNVVLNGGVSTGFAQGGVGGRVGATFAW